MRKREARKWDQAHDKLVDLSAFQHGPIAPYDSLIRRGKRTPHPRHWQRLLDTAAAD